MRERRRTKRRKRGEGGEGGEGVEEKEGEEAHAHEHCRFTRACRWKFLLTRQSSSPTLVRWLLWYLRDCGWRGFASQPDGDVALAGTVRWVYKRYGKRREKGGSEVASEVDQPEIGWCALEEDCSRASLQVHHDLSVCFPDQRPKAPCRIHASQSSHCGSPLWRSLRDSLAFGRSERPRLWSSMGASV